MSAYSTWSVDIKRAILDAANAFGSLAKVCEEYLTNSIDAFETIVHDHPEKELDRRQCKIEITIDNKDSKLRFVDEHQLMGMSQDVLFKSFFNLHGENISRKRSIFVRGKYGTGKTAAFGIGAEELIVDTISNGKRNKIRALKKDLLAGNTNLISEIVDQSTSDTAGTVIEIKSVKPKYISERSIESAKKHIQKLLGYRLDMYNIVLVIRARDGEERAEKLTYEPPTAVYEKIYEPSNPLKKFTGNTKLIIRRSADPLSEDVRGISITSNGYPREITLFGLEREKFADRFFGEWEIPSLDTYEGDNPPFLSTRELKLNRENELVKLLFDFGKEIISQEIKDFAQDERQRKQDEDTKKLSNIAEELSTILDEDFKQYDSVEKSGDGRRKEAPCEDGGAGGQSPHSDGELDGFSTSGNVGIIDSAKGLPVTGETEGQGIDADTTSSKDQRTAEESSQADKLGRRIRYKNAAARGGFRIKFEHLNHNEWMAKGNGKMITVNLDAEPIKTHLGFCYDMVENPQFRMFAYSVAIDEYCKYCIYTQADNDEFFEEPGGVAREVSTELLSKKKRLMDMISSKLQMSS
ncbi:MAG: ATP-binding protein [Deltaproteobacteria bacterium]|nr:ATP-binding protein [Deltaproteobacteria bacterium]